MDQLGLARIIQVGFILRKEFNFDFIQYWKSIPSRRKEEVQPAVEKAQREHPGIWESPAGRSVLISLAWEAIHDGLFETLRYLVEQQRVAVNTQATVEGGSWMSISLLEEAIIQGDEDLALYLLSFLKEDEVENVYTIDGLDAGTVLHAACVADMTEVVKRLVMEHNADVDALDYMGHKAICKALTTKRDGGTLRFLIDHYTALGRKEEMLGSSCCQQTIKNLNLLGQAIRFGSLEAVIYLVKDIGEDLTKEHFICKSVDYGGKRKFSMFLHHFAMINQFSTTRHQFAMINYAHKEKFEWLLTEGGAPVKMVTTARQTSFHILCSVARPKIENQTIATAKFLINKCKMTNIGSRDMDGMTASAYALQQGCQRLHDYLLLEEKARDIEVRLLHVLNACVHQHSYFFTLPF